MVDVIAPVRGRGGRISEGGGSIAKGPGGVLPRDKVAETLREDTPRQDPRAVAEATSSARGLADPHFVGVAIDGDAERGMACGQGETSTPDGAEGWSTVAVVWK